MVYFSLAPLLVIASFVVGLTMLIIGLRGRPVFTAPRCARCRYDLRTLSFMEGTPGRCPECGCDLSVEGNVNFGRLKRWRKMIVTGMLVMILPWVLLFAAVFAFRSRAITGSSMPTAATPTATILRNLPADIDHPWNWQELQRRLQTPGALTQAEVDQALTALTADLKAKRAKGQPVTFLHWSGSFVEKAITAGVCSASARDAFVRAYFADPGEATLRNRVRTGELLVVRLGSESHADLTGFTWCWALQSIVADGKVNLSPTDRYDSHSSTATHPDRFSGSQHGNSIIDMTITQTLPPGEHEIVFTFDVGLVPSSTTFRGLDGRPGTFDKWPTPLAHRQTTLKRRVTVVPADQAVIDLVTDPAQDPASKGTAVSVAEALVRPASNGADLAITWKYNGTVPKPGYSYRVEVTANGTRISFGQFVWAPYRGNGSSTSISDHCQIAPLPPDVRQLDIELIPDPKCAEDNPETNRIWGKGIRFPAVPLQRYDLPK